MIFLKFIIKLFASVIKDHLTYLGDSRFEKESKVRRTKTIERSG